MADVWPTGRVMAIDLRQQHHVCLGPDYFGAEAA